MLLYVVVACACRVAWLGACTSGAYGHGTAMKDDTGWEVSEMT